MVEATSIINFFFLTAEKDLTEGGTSVRLNECLVQRRPKAGKLYNKAQIPFRAVSASHSSRGSVSAS